MRILIIEDDWRLGVTLADSLTEQKYLVDLARDRQEAIEAIQSIIYNLLIIDVILPGTDGITLCRQLRSRGFTGLILFLTARTNSSEVVKGLDAGADDYLFKPFVLEVLHARIRALLRRSSASSPLVLQWGDLNLIPDSGEVYYRNRPLQLTSIEFRLLEIFLSNQRKIFNYTDIIEYVWPLDSTPSESTVRSHIKKLRKKLKAAGVEVEAIETIYGMGYRLNRQEIVEGSVTGDEHKQTSSTRLLQKKQQTAAALASSWEQFKESILEDVAFLNRVAQGLTISSSSEQLPQAIKTAHNLVGVLGSLGLEHEAEMARHIELLWQLPSVEIQQRLNVLQQSLSAISKTTVQERLVSATFESRESALLLIIDEEADLAVQLRQRLDIPIRIWTANSFSDARKQISHQVPDLLIVSRELDGDGLTLLEEIRAQTHQVPVIVCSASGELRDRLAALQANTSAFLKKPHSLEQILAVIKGLLRQSSEPKQKILAVDDNLQFLLLLQNKLATKELEVIALTEPWQFWQTLETVLPNLLILDIKMPNINGIELCRVVRNDPNWNTLPILFLTAYDNQEHLQQCFQAGANDFLSKSTSNLELRCRIFSHLQCWQSVP